MLIMHNNKPQNKKLVRLSKSLTLVFFFFADNILDVLETTMTLTEILNIKGY